jgi:electron transfer flavoprotein beta subunit
MAATDSTMGVVPAMLAERLDVPGVTYLDELEVDAGSGTVTGRREAESATERISAAIPAVVSVTDRTGEARYPSFKGIMSAKKKPLDTLGLADLGIDPARVGLAAAGSAVDSAAKRPPRVKGEVLADEGEGGLVLAAFLASRKFI